VLARLRIGVPDRPGALGRIASAIGSAGADIVKDDVFVQIRDAGQVDRVRDHLQAISGVQVTGVQVPVPPVTGHTDLELVSQVMAQPDRGLRTLVDGAPGALGADWAALVEFGRDGAPGPVLAVSPACPGEDHVTVIAPLRLATLRLTPPGGSEPYGGAALVPLGGTPVGLVLVRVTGPEFHRTELWRLEQLGSVLGGVVDRVGTA
jgi:hypothetical protein